MAPIERHFFVIIPFVFFGLLISRENLLTKH